MIEVQWIDHNHSVFESVVLKWSFRHERISNKRDWSSFDSSTQTPYYFRLIGLYLRPSYMEKTEIRKVRTNPMMKEEVTAMMNNGGSNGGDVNQEIRWKTPSVHSVKHSKYLIS